MPANKLEKGIISAAKDAAVSYSQMTGGYWLWHAPEHFLQNEVARAIWKEGFYVFVDTSGDRVRADLVGVRGRRPGTGRKRFDISVFYKHGNKVRAVIELKTRATYSVTATAQDAKKIENHFKNANHATSGYLLVYGEADSAQRPNAEKSIETRFATTFPKRLGPQWQLVTFFLGPDKYVDEKRRHHAWAIALYRFA
jgi:hypothetical protein